MFENIKGVIFDLDGTLVDSMWVWSKIDLDFITERKLEITQHQLMKDVAHFSFSETANYFREKFELSETVEEIQDIWIEAAETEYCENVRLKPGARQFLEQLRQKGIRMAIATSNTRHLLNSCLKANEIEHYFDILVTTDETAVRTKAKPDVYLLAAKKLGITPTEIVVFEDIIHAMAGARAAGMKVVAVQDAHTTMTKEEAAALADLYISDFTDLLQHPDFI